MVCGLADCVGHSRSEVCCSPEVTGLQRNTPMAFTIGEYIEERRRAQQIILDGVYEMMNLARFQKWASATDRSNVKWPSIRSSIEGT
eukprot:1282635-Amphidinium_carterae.1